MQDWTRDDGENTRRLDYPLDKNSVVFDVGAHVGKWSEAIATKYGCQVYAFEPVPDHYERARVRLSGFPGVHVVDAGIAATCADRMLWVKWDASSAVIPQPGAPEIMAKFYSLGFALRLYDIAVLDLLKLNCEGAEFEIMENLLASGLISRIRFIQIQYHSGVECGEERYAAICAKLNETHMKQWGYGWMWESWGRRA